MKKKISVLLVALVLTFALTISASAAVPSQTFMLPEIGEAYSTNYFINAPYADCMAKVLAALNFRVDNVPAPKDVYFIISSSYSMNLSQPTQNVTPATEFPQVSYYSAVGEPVTIYAAGNGAIIATPSVSAITFNGVAQTIEENNIINVTVNQTTTYNDIGSVTLNQKSHVTITSGTTEKTALVDAGTVATIASFTDRTSATGQELIDKSPMTIKLVAVDADNTDIPSLTNTYTVNFVAQ